MNSFARIPHPFPSLFNTSSCFFLYPFPFHHLAYQVPFAVGSFFSFFLCGAAGLRGTFPDPWPGGGSFLRKNPPPSVGFEPTSARTATSEHCLRQPCGHRASCSLHFFTVYCHYFPPFLSMHPSSPFSCRFSLIPNFTPVIILPVGLPFLFSLFGPLTFTVVFFR
jgi:hypothetical protein